MNHTYRLVWNDAIGAYVPAPEFARSRTKKSRGKALAGAVFSALSGLSACYFLLHPGAGMAASIVPDGRTQTTVTTHGSVTDITTQTVRGANAFNSFSRFNVDSGQTANLHLPEGTKNLLNLVHGERSHIDGTLNAYKDGRIGGNVFFLNPHGVVVGAEGVINVGSLTMATPTPAFMNALVDPSGLIDDAAVANVLSGQVPLTDSGLIQVKGRVNALDAVHLHAGQVAVEAGARVIAGPRAQVEFGDLVNIEGVAVAGGVEVENGVIRITALGDAAIAGTIAADGTAGVDAGRIDIHAGADIHLAAGAEVTANGQGAASSGGNVTIFADQDATLDSGARVAANGGVSGDGGFVEFSAQHNVVLKGGQLTAEASQGRAGTVLIDPENISFSGSGNDYFSATNYVLTASNSITLSDVVISTRNVAAEDRTRDKIDSAASIGNSGSITLEAPNITLNSGTRLLAHATNGYSAGDITLRAEKSDHMAGYRDVDASTSIVIDGATLKGNNITLTATSDAGYDWDGDAADIAVRAVTDPVFGSLFSNLTGLNVGAAISNAKAEVLVKSGSLIDAQGSGGSVVIKADSTSTAEHLKVGLDALTKRWETLHQVANVGFVWGQVDATATVNVAGGATIKADTLDLSAVNRATTNLNVVSLSKDTMINAGGVVNKANVQSTATIDSTATIEVNKSVSILAHNENRFSSSVTALALGSGQVGAAVNYTELNTSATASNSANLNNLSNVKIEALDDTVTNKSAAATAAGSGTIAHLTVEKVLEGIDALVDKLFGKVEAGQQALDGMAGGGKPKLGAAVTYAENNHNAAAFIGEQAQVNAAQDVVVAAKVNDQRIRTHATAGVEGKKGDPHNPGVSAGLAGAVSIGMFKHNADAHIGDNAKITAQHVGVVSDLSIPYEITWAKWEGASTIFNKLNSNLGIGDGLLSGWSNASIGGCVDKCLAGSVTYMDYDNVSRAYLGRSVEVEIRPGGTDTWSTLLTGDSSAFVGTNDTTIPATRTQDWSSPLHVLAKSDVEGVFAAGNMSLLVNGVGGEPGASVLGGTYNQINFDTSTKAWISEGAVVQQFVAEGQPAGSVAPVDITVQADARTQITAVAPSAGRGSTYGVSGTFSMVKVNDTTEASIDDEANVTGARVDIKAETEEIAWSLTGALNMADSVGVGVGVALNDVTADTRAMIADNDANNEGGSKLDKTDGKVKANELDVAARTDGRIEAIAIAGAAESSADPDDLIPITLTDALKGVMHIAWEAVKGLFTKAPEMAAETKNSGPPPSASFPPSSNFGIAVAGSSAVNLADLNTHAYVADANVELNSSADATSVAIRAINDTDITAATGSGALLRVENRKASYSVGIGGSVAVNLIDNTTEAYLKKAKVTDADDLQVAALAGGEQLAVAIGAELNASANQAKAASVAGSVSINKASNTVSSRIEGSTITGRASGTDRTLDVVAYDRLRLGTGGGSLILGGKGGFGAAISYSGVSNTTEALIDDSTVTNYDKAQLHALTATKVGTGGGMTGGTWAHDGVSIGGAFVVSEIANTTRAEIRNNASVTTNSLVDVRAADTTGIAELDTLIDAKDDGNPNSSSLDYDGTEIGSTAGVGSSIVTVAGVAQIGVGNAGMGFAYNKIANKFTSSVSGSTVSAGSTGTVNVVAESNTKMLGLGIGLGVATDRFAGAGSLALSEIENTITAEVSSTSTKTITAGNLTVKAEDKSTAQSFAGNVTVSTGSAAVGAAVAVSEIANTATAKISNMDIDARNSARIEANNDSLIQTLAASAGGASNFAFNGSAAVGTIGNTTQALVEKSKSDDKTATLSVRAVDSAQIDSLAGDAAIKAGGGAAGVGVSVNRIDNTTTAAVEGVATENDSYAVKNLLVEAASDNTIRTLAAGAGYGKTFGVDGSFSTNFVESDTQARINDAKVTAEENVAVLASTDDSISVIAGAAGIGKSATGLGVSVVYNEIDGKTDAHITGSTVTAKGSGAALAVNSGTLADDISAGSPLTPSATTPDFTETTTAVKGLAVVATSHQGVNADAVSLGLGSSGVGIVSVTNVMGGATQAYIGDSSINTGLTGGADAPKPQVYLNASSYSYAGSLVLGLAGGGSGSGHAALAVNKLTRRTDAHVDSTSIGSVVDDAPTVGPVTVQAIDWKSAADVVVGFDVGKGSFGGGGTGIIDLFDTDTQAYVTGGNLKASDLNVKAATTSGAHADTGGGAFGATAGIGAAFVAIDSDNTTKAYVGKTDTGTSLTLSGTLNVEAASSNDYHSTVISGAGGGKAGIAGMADVTLLDNTTAAGLYGVTANVGGSTPDAKGNVTVSAKETVSVDAIAGALGGGITGGVGAGANVVIVKSSVTSEVADSDITSNGTVDVSASSAKHINAITVTAAGGGTLGIGAGAALILVGDGDTGEVMAELDHDGAGTLTAVDEATSQHGLSVAAAVSQANHDEDEVKASIDGASTISADTLNVSAAGQVATRNIVGAAGLGGKLGVGGGVAYTRVYDNISASSAATVTAPHVNVTASMADGSQGAAADNRAYAGAAGLVGLGAAVADAAISNQVSASVTGTLTGDGSSGSQVLVQATDSSSVDVEAVGASAGAATVGVVLGYAAKSSAVTADLLPTRIGSYDNGTASGTYSAVNVAASGAGAVSGSAIAAAGGAYSGTGAEGWATDATAVTARVGGTLTLGTDGLAVSAAATPNVSAEALGVSVGGVSVGASVATAEASPTVTAAVADGTTFHGAAGVLVRAVSEYDEDDHTAEAKAVAGSGGTLIGVNASDATARSNANVTARIGNKVTLPTGDVTIAAINNSSQYATATGVGPGYLAFGANLASASADGSTTAQLGAGTITDEKRTGNLRITANGSDTNSADATAGSGGMVAGNAALASTENTATTTAQILGDTTAATIHGNNFLIEAEHGANYSASADSVNAVVFGGSGADASNTVSASTLAAIGDGVKLKATGSIVGIAGNAFHQTGGGATAAGGGVLSGQAALSSTTVTGAATMRLGDDVSLSAGTDANVNPGLIDLVAYSELTGSNEASLTTGGAIAGAGVDASLSATLANAVVTGARNTLFSYGNIGLGTWTIATPSTFGLVSTWGLATAVGSANASTNVTTNQSVTVGKDTTMTGVGNVNLTAGEDPFGYWGTSLVGSSIAEGYVRGLIAVPHASATVDLTSNASLDIATGVKINSGQNVTIGAYHGKLSPTVDATGRGYEIGFIPVTDGSPHVSTHTTATVTNNGTVTAGIFHEQTITIENCRDSGSFCSKVKQTSGAPVSYAWNPAFDPQKFVMENFDGTAEALLLSGVSSTPVGAISLAGLFASGGTVTVNADTIHGNGTITSYGDPSITVNNYSSNYLIFNGANIPYLPGAKIIFTGAAGEEQARAAGLTLNTIGTGSAPTITINNAYQGAIGTTSGNYGPALFLLGEIENLGGLVSISNASGSFGQAGAIFGQQVNINTPAGVTVITAGQYHAGGNPYSQWWNAMIWPGGNPAAGKLDANMAVAYVANAMFNANGQYGTNWRAFTEALIGRAGDATNLAGANFSTKAGVGSVLFFADGTCRWYGCGGFNSGHAATLSPINQFVAVNPGNDNEIRFPAVPAIPTLSVSKSYADANLTGSQGSSAIYGAQVQINAGIIDVNAKIVAGQPTNWSLYLPESLLTTLAKYRNDYLNARTSQEWFNIQLAVSRVGDSQITARYNARTHEIVLDNVSASSGGGKVILKGGILSTTTLGHIHVNGGLGDVYIDNRTGIPLVVNNVNAGNIALAQGLSSSVEIIDTFQPSSSNHWLYSYTPGTGLTVYRGSQSTPAENLPQYSFSSTATTKYNPTYGLRWGWQLQATLSREIVLDAQYIIIGLGNWVWDFPAGQPNNPWQYVQASSGIGSSPFDTDTKSLSWLLSTTPTGAAFVQPGLPDFVTEITGGITNNYRVNYGYAGCEGSSSCNFGFRHNGYNDANQPRAYWTYVYPTSVWLKQTSSVKADNPITIDFSGNATGRVVLNSNAPVTLAGQITNPNGITTISARGPIMETATGSLWTGDLTLNTNSATAGIGTADSPFAATLSERAVVNAQGGKDGVYLSFNSAAVLGQVTAGSALNGYGDVVITTAYDMQGAADHRITGRNITLTSDLGAVGSAASPLSLAADSGGVVNVSALNDIAIQQTTGDLLAGSIASATGNVYVNVVNGALLNASGQTAAQTLSEEQVREIWRKLHLTAEEGAASNAVATSVMPLQNLVNGYYRQYWRLLDHGMVVDGTFLLDSSAIALYAPLAAAALSIPEPTEAQVRDYANGLYQNIAESLTRTVGVDWSSRPDFQTYNPNFSYTVTAEQAAELTRDAVWTEAELRYAINRTALEPASGTVGNAAPNISGRDMTLIAKNIGKLAAPVRISLADIKSGNLTPEQQAALAVAIAPGDVVPVDADGNVVPLDSPLLAEFRIAQTAPFFVASLGKLTADSDGVAYIQSTVENLTLASIKAAGAVSLAAPQSILSALSAGSTSPLITTNGDLTLVAGSGNLGSETNPLTFLLNGGRLAAASAGQNAWLETPDGDMTVGRVFAVDTAALYAPNGSILTYLPGVAINANDIVLVAGQDIGSPSAYLWLQNGQSGTLSGSAGGTAWIYGANTSLQGVSFTAGNDLNVTTEKDLDATSLVAENGNVVVASGGDADITSVTAANGAATLSAVGTLTVDTVSSKGTVTSISGGDMSVGSVTSATGAVTLTSTGGALDVETVTGNDAVTLAAAHAITLAGRLTSGGAATLTAGDDLRLAGGSVHSAGAAILQAGTDGSGGIIIGAESSGGEAIDSGAALTLTAANGIAVEGRVQAAGDLTAAAGDEVVLAGGRLASGGALALQAGTDGTGAITIGAESAGGEAIDAASTLTLTAANGITVDGRVKSGAAAMLTAGDEARFTGGRLASTGSVVLTAGSDGSGAIAIAAAAGGGDAISSGATLKVVAADSVTLSGRLQAVEDTVVEAGDDLHLAGGSVRSAGAVALLAGTDGSGGITIGAESSGGEAIDSGAALSLVAANGITVEGWVQAAGDLTAAAGDDLILAGGRLASDGAVALQAGTDTSGSIAIGVAASGDEAIDAASTLSLAAANGITVDGHMKSGGAATLTADDDVQFTGGRLTSTGAVELLAGTDGSGGIVIGAERNGAYAIDTASTLKLAAVDAITLMGDIHAAGDAAVIAGGDLRLITSRLLSSGGAVTLTSTGGALTATTVSGQGDVTLRSAADLAVGSVTSTAGTVTLTSTGGALDVATLTSGQGATLTAAGDLTGGTLSVQGGDAALTAQNGNVTLTHLTATGNAAVQAGGTLTVADQLTASGEVSLSAGEDLHFGTIQGGGDVTLHGAGDVAGTTLSATGGMITATADGALKVATVSGRGDVTLRSVADLAVGSVTSTAGAVALTATGGALDVETVTGNDAVTLAAAHAITLAGRLTSGGAATLTAGDDLRLAGGSVHSAGAAILQAGTDGSGGIIIGAESSGGEAIDSGAALSLVAANGITVDGRVTSGGAATLTAGDDLRFTGGRLASTGAVVLTAGTDGTGGITIGAERNGDYAIDTDSTLKMVAANGIIVEGRIRAAGNATIAAGDDLQFAGGSLSSNGAVHLEAGTDGSGSVSVGAASGGGNVIDALGVVDITAADDIVINAAVSGAGIRLDAGRTIDMNGGAIKADGPIDMVTDATLVIGGDIVSGTGVGLTSSNDVVFAGGSVASNGDVRIVAGTDGTGSIHGSAAGEVDVIAQGALLMQAPDSIGADAPIVAQVAGQATFLSATVRADVSALRLSDPLVLSVSDIGGGPAAEVMMTVRSDRSVTFDTFNVGAAAITAHTPSLQIPAGRITDSATFDMPGYSARIDAVPRAAHPGYGVYAFTLDGEFSLDALRNSVAMDAFILKRNPHLPVAGNPPGVVVDTAESAMQTQSSGNSTEVGVDRVLGSKPAPSDEALIEISTDWSGDVSHLLSDEREEEIGS